MPNTKQLLNNDGYSRDSNPKQKCRKYTRGKEKHRNSNLGNKLGKQNLSQQGKPKLDRNVIDVARLVGKILQKSWEESARNENG